jgi:hypothetical protein
MRVAARVGRRRWLRTLSTRSPSAAIGGGAAARRLAISSIIFKRPAVDSSVAAFDATLSMAWLPDHALPKALGRLEADLRIALAARLETSCGPLSSDKRTSAPA